jgi:hypothetical protein
MGQGGVSSPGQKRSFTRRERLRPGSPSFLTKRAFTQAQARGKLFFSLGKTTRGTFGGRFDRFGEGKSATIKTVSAPRIVGAKHKVFSATQAFFVTDLREGD